LDLRPGAQAEMKVNRVLIGAWQRMRDRLRFGTRDK
jgi:hypothetical protein